MPTQPYEWVLSDSRFRGTCERRSQEPPRQHHLGRIGTWSSGLQGAAQAMSPSQGPSIYTSLACPRRYPPCTAPPLHTRQANKAAGVLSALVQTVSVWCRGPLTWRHGYSWCSLVKCHRFCRLSWWESISPLLPLLQRLGNNQGRVCASRPAVGGSSNSSSWARRRVVGNHERGAACALWMRLGEKLCRGGTRLW